MKKIIYICSIVGFGIGLYGLWRIKQPATTNLVKCYYEDSVTYSVKTSQECGEMKEMIKREKEMMSEKAKILNCRWNYGRCYSYFGEKKYIWLDDEWKETEASKICSPYADKRVSDLPIKCLDYFGLKK